MSHVPYIFKNCGRTGQVCSGNCDWFNVIILTFYYVLSHLFFAPSNLQLVHLHLLCTTLTHTSGYFFFFVKLALVVAVVVLLFHQGVLMCQYLPLGRYTLVCWKQTPWHTGGHLPEETSWGLSRNSDTWEKKQRRSRDGGRQTEQQSGKGRRWKGAVWVKNDCGCLASSADLGWIMGYQWTSHTSPVAVGGVSDALSAVWSPPSWSWLFPCSCPCTWQRTHITPGASVLHIYICTHTRG